MILPLSLFLIAAMTRRYPSAGLPVALQIGATVVKGEMKWGVSATTTTGPGRRR